MLVRQNLRNHRLHLTRYVFSGWRFQRPFRFADVAALTPGVRRILAEQHTRGAWCSARNAGETLGVELALDAFAEGVDDFVVAFLDALTPGVLVEQFQIALARFWRFREYPGQTFRPGVGEVRRVRGVRARSGVGDAAGVVGGGAATALDHQFGLGGDGDAVGVGSDVEFGQQVDAVLEGLDVDVAGGRDQAPAHALHEQTHATAGTGQQAFANGKTGVPGAAQRQVFTGGDMAGARRGQGDTGGTREHQMRLGEFREFIGSHVRRATAEHALMLRVQRLGHIVLIAGLLRLKLFGLSGETVLLIARGGEALGGFRQVFVVLRFVRARLGGDQQTGASTHRAMAVGAQLETFATRLPAARARVCQVAEVDRTGAVITAQRNTDLTGGVVDAQFVGAAALVFLALDRGQGLEVRQFVRRQIRAVVQATGDQRLIGIAFEEGDQHLHADPRNVDRAKGFRGPVRGHTHPATGLVVVLAFAIPEELHLHPTVLVAVNFFALRAADHGALSAEDFRFRVIERRPVRHVPRDRVEAVAVALVEIVLVVGGVAGHRLFEHLRLLAFVEDLGEQPQIVPGRVGVFGEGEKMPADQNRLIAVALGQTIVAAMAFQCAIGQMLAALAVNETPRVIVIFQIRLGAALGIAFELDLRFDEVVITSCGAAGAGRQTQAETLDHWLIGDQSGVLLISHWRQFREHRLVIAEHQFVAAGGVLEVVVNPLLLTQALDEMQIAFVVLHAVDALRINRAQLEVIVTGENAVFFQHLADDLLHGHLLEDALVDPMREVRQLRAQGDFIAGQALAGLALGDAVDQPVNPRAAGRQLQEREFVQQAFEVDRGLLTDQFQLKLEGGVERLFPGERQHLEIAVRAIDGQIEMRLIGR